VSKTPTTRAELTTWPLTPTGDDHDHHRHPPPGDRREDPEHRCSHHRLPRPREALKTLALPAAGRKPLPVFSRILATVRADEIELTTFDFDTAATVTLPATGTRPGQLLLDHPSLTKVLSAAVKGSRKATVDQLDVTIDTPDHTPVVHVAGYSLPLDDTVTVDAFPDLPPTTARPTSSTARH
jgi:hypothetical protein